MNRFFGKMPSDEVEISKQYIDEYGLTITIEAGPHGYTIIYADGSSHWQDIDQSSEENFDKALEIATNNLGTLFEKCPSDWDTMPIEE